MKALKGGEAGRKKKSEKSRKGGEKKLAQSHLEGTEKVFLEVERGKTKAVMYPRDTILVGMEDLSGKGGAVASGVSLFQQLGGWHLNLNCWVSSGVCGMCMGCAYGGMCVCSCPCLWY